MRLYRIILLAALVVSFCSGGGGGPRNPDEAPPDDPGDALTTATTARGLQASDASTSRGSQAASTRNPRALQAPEGDPCSNDSDCQNFACARQFAETTSPTVCCLFGDYVYVSPTLGFVCTGQEEGAECLVNRDDLCLSNVCVKGTCLADPLANGESCDSNADCFNFKCGRVAASILESNQICCPSDTSFFVDFLGNICGDQDDGKPCAGNDDLCLEGSSCLESGVCGVPGADPPAMTPTGDCISDTDEILSAELDADSSNLRTYILCPDTTFPIGTFNFDSFDYENGMAALELFKSNIHVLCGADGSVDNNCVFEGGTSHVEIFFSQDGDARLQDVLLQGITFKGAEEYNAAFFARGEVTFRDCMFTENQNTAILDVIGNNYEGELSVSIEQCVFTQNTVSYFDEEDGITALVYLGGQSMTVTDSLFQDNVLVMPEGVVVGEDWETVVILVFGVSELVVEGSCFAGNDVSAVIYGDDDFVYNDDDVEGLAVSNYASGASVCNGLTGSNANGCLEFQMESCSMNGFVVPAPTPAGAVITPSPTPTPPAAAATPTEAPSPAGGNNGTDPNNLPPTPATAPCTRSLCPEGSELTNPDFGVPSDNDEKITCGETDATLKEFAADEDAACEIAKAAARDAGCACREGPTTASTASSGVSSLDNGGLCRLSGCVAATLAAYMILL